MPDCNLDCFLTDPGALLRAILLDLPRVEIKPDPVESWCTAPVALPVGWEAIEVERLWARGEPWRLTARHGCDHACLGRDA